MSYNRYEVTTDYTKQLAHYIAATRYEDILPAVIERAKMLVLHTLGVSLCAVDLPQSQDTLAIARELSAGGGKGVGELHAGVVEVFGQGGQCALVGLS